MNKVLTQAEVTLIHQEIAAQAVSMLGVTIR